MIQQPRQLREMSEEQLFNSFFSTVLVNLISEPERLELSYGGGDWLKMRQTSFIRRRRTSSLEASLAPLEQKLRQGESRVALEMCYRSGVLEGIDKLQLRAPEVVQGSKATELKAFYRPARMHPRPRIHYSNASQQRK